MNVVLSLAADFQFAEDSGEFASAATLLRYVAAINIECSCEQFVAAAVAAGHRANSAANRFRESRAISRQWDLEDSLS